MKEHMKKSIKITRSVLLAFIVLIFVPLCGCVSKAEAGYGDYDVKFDVGKTEAYILDWYWNGNPTNFAGPYKK